MSGTCPAKIARQPKVEINGPPITTPMTGPPAATIDHHPSAFTRSVRLNTRAMSANDAGPVAAPCAAARIRKAMREPALHATALAAALTMAPESPSRNTRRWPQMSPSFPTAGPMMPKARIGPLTTQVSVLWLASRSPAMRGMETARMVTVTLTVNSPSSRATRTIRGEWRLSSPGAPRRSPPRAGSAGATSAPRPVTRSTIS